MSTDAELYEALKSGNVRTVSALLYPESVPMHECNDCGIQIEDHREICSLCERWYEERGLPLPTVTRKPDPSDLPDEAYDPDDFRDQPR